MELGNPVALTTALTTVLSSLSIFLMGQGECREAVFDQTGLQD